MIPVKNVFYMLSYAFRELKLKAYKKVETEDFENVADLCAELLCIGVQSQVKRGLNKAYLERKEATASLRGRIDVTDSIKELTMLKRQMYCSFDEFSTNSYMNRIVKTTLQFLRRSKIDATRKKKIRNLLVYFADVDTLEINEINWHQRFDKNNQTYRMLISVCYLVLSGLLQTQQDGSKKLMDFLDDQRMHRLYERFIFEYYNREYKGVLATRAPLIDWNSDDGMTDFLPVMRSDVVLSRGNKVLIIDAKFYSHNMQSRYGSFSVHSANLYQVFTYTKNMQIELGDEKVVSGMLLYAKTGDKIQPDNTYLLSGNKLAVKALDLSDNFDVIRRRLDGIVAEYFEC